MLRQPEAIRRAWLWMDWRRFQCVSFMTGDQTGLAYSRTDLMIDLLVRRIVSLAQPKLDPARDLSRFIFFFALATVCLMPLESVFDVHLPAVTSCKVSKPSSPQWKGVKLEAIRRGSKQLKLVK